MDRLTRKKNWLTDYHLHLTSMTFLKSALHYHELAFLQDFSTWMPQRNILLRAKEAAQSKGIRTDLRERERAIDISDTSAMMI
jgi:hypothetical protein